jgi:hypothetical protein
VPWVAVSVRYDPELMDGSHVDIGEQAHGLRFSLPVNVDERTITGHRLVQSAVVGRREMEWPFRIRSYPKLRARIETWTVSGAVHFRVQISVHLS